MEPCPAHQLILPTDKRNPCFSVYASDDGLDIEVFYGLELLEVVPDDNTHPAFKMMVGRLANANVKIATLEEVFGVDRKTIRSWGQAIQSRDPNLLERVLLGRSVNQKRTPTIDKYVVRRWAELCSEGRPDFRATLVREVENIFDVKFSGETLRQIVNEFTTEKSTIPEPFSPTDASQATVPISMLGELICRESICSDDNEATSTDLVSNEPQSNNHGTSNDFLPPTDTPQDSKCFPSNWQPNPGDTILCDHVGMLIFASALSSITHATTPAEPLLAQWLGSILLGAVNIEQTKYLNWDDLGNLLGQTVRFPTPQREQLTRLANSDVIDAVLRWNYQQLTNTPGEPTDNDFYYDPHTAHYTGMQKVLKGWCASLRWADKIINSDYIHSSKGHPIYFECTDNFDDLRIRFLPLIRRLRTCLQWNAQRVLTFVVDRGIYSNDIFHQVHADPAIHLITWEKGYQSGTDAAWKILVNEHKAAGTYDFHCFQRQRNNARDQRPYYFEYIHRPWAKNPAIRQIIARATNPHGRVVELSILTDDAQRPVGEIVKLIFNRWIQENDFKYLNKHFGINQLTSYRSTPYEQLRDQLTDRLVPNSAYLAKVKIGRLFDQQKARLLLAEDKAQRDQSQRQLNHDQIQARIANRAVQDPGNLAHDTATAEEKKKLPVITTPPNGTTNTVKSGQSKLKSSIIRS